jgi:sugar O-acyltransferase (sialic acid O-acetyltransferase NeuD family)
VALLPVLVFGAGGHGRVVAEVVQAMGLAVEGFVDDGVPAGERVLGLPVLGTSAWLSQQSPRTVALGLGDNHQRQALAAALASAGHTAGTFVHPRAWVSPTAQLGAGTVVMANAVVNAEARVGRGVILNSACVVEHECVVGDFAHISPRAALGGRAKVGARTHVGIGATVLNLATVGDDCIIGGGAVVLKAVESGVTAVGVPARRLR